MARSLKISFIVIGVTFVIFFIGMFHFVRTAMRAYEPPIDARYYEKGLDYQKRVDEFNRAKATGWSMKVNLLEQDAVSRGALPLKIILDRDSTKPPLPQAEKDPGRIAVTVLVSHRASTEGSQKYEFRESDLEAKGSDRFELNRSIENPLGGNVEISVEARPTKDSAIYQSKNLVVN